MHNTEINNVVFQKTQRSGGASMGKLQITPGEIISFWLDAGKDKWFGQDEQFDALIRENFLTLWRAALSGRLKHWLESDEGILALTIILDQFPRYMFRDDPRAYCSDNDARKIAQLALEKQTDQRIAPELRGFLYMPFEHSEKIADQEKSIELFTALKNETLLQSAEIHCDIIRQFGRFPQRNKIVGRKTSPDEQIFLDKNNNNDRN